MATTLVTVRGKWLRPDGIPSCGDVTFTPSANGIVDATDLNFAGGAVKRHLALDGSISVGLIATDDPQRLPTGWVYIVKERIDGLIRVYPINVPFADATTGLDLELVAPVPTPGGGGQGPQELLITTAGSGVYAIPATASIISFEAVGGGGGGGGGSKGRFDTAKGAGGGGGGGKTQKRFNAAALRAAYPAGIPYTVGAGGVGGAGLTVTGDGNVGLAGGFTFAGDFVVATPGNFYFQAQGGGTINGVSGLAGSAGLGDTQGCAGGLGGGWAAYIAQGNSFTDYTGSGGGYPAINVGLADGVAGFTFIEYVGAGGGGQGGGGSGGISNITFNGGPSGFSVTSDSSPLVGSAGITGGAHPTTGGVSVMPGNTSCGGGGGGASDTIGQNGADAAPGTGSGGGGGGNSSSGNSGHGGAGASGYLRIVAS